MFTQQIATLDALNLNYGALKSCESPVKPLLTICLLAVLTACGGSPELEPLDPGDVLLAFGDSLTYGTGAEPSTSYPSRLGELLDMQVVNAGVPGETSNEGLLRLPTLLQEHQPALVIICHGGNDILRRRSMSSLEAALREMITHARNSGADVVMLAVPGRNLMLNPPDLYQRVADDLEVPIDVDTLPRLVANRKMKSDQVHLNATGYAHLADALHQLMRDAGGIED